MQKYDEACYAVLHAFGESPVGDLWFSIYSRFSGKTPRSALCVYRTATAEIESIEITGLPKRLWPCGWMKSDGKWRWLASWRDDNTQRCEMLVIDVQDKSLVERWEVPGNDMFPMQMAGQGLWFISTSPHSTDSRKVPYPRAFRGPVQPWRPTALFCWYSQIRTVYDL